MAKITAAALELVSFEYGNPGDIGYVGPMTGNVVYNVDNGDQIVTADSPDGEFAAIVVLHDGCPCYAVRLTDAASVKPAYAEAKRFVGA